MNVKTFLVLAFCGLGTISVVQMACVRNTLTAPALAAGVNNGGSSAPTPTPTSAPMTYNVSIGSSGSSATGYIYTLTGGTNGTGGLLTFSAHVGDTVNLPSSSYHPLYFDNGSTTCLTVGGSLISGYTNGTITYVFPAAGTYYFHCGYHATGCTPSNASCGSTSCNALAGMVNVS